MARETYLTAWNAACFTAHLDDGAVLVEISRAVEALPALGSDPRPLDLLLDGLALLITGGNAAAFPALRRAADAHVGERAEEVLRWGSVSANGVMWDVEGMHATYVRQVQLVRDAGALAHLPLFLSRLAIASAWLGDFAGAALLIAECDSVAAATGSQIGTYAVLRLRALQGAEAEASATDSERNRARPSLHAVGGRGPV